MPRAWHNIRVAIISPAMATKRKVYTVTTKIQATEVAEKNSKEAAAMSAKNFQCKYSNEHDEHAVAVLNNGEIVGHLPPTISRVSWFFLRHSSCIVCRVTGKRRHDNGLEVPCICVYFGHV